MMIIRCKIVLSALLVLGCTSAVHRVPQEEASFPVVAADASVATAKPAGRDSAPLFDIPITGRIDTLWTIESGTYAGVRVPLDLRAALGNPKRDHFWRLARNANVTEGLVGWKSTRYPIPVAFRHSRRGQPISESDSIAFWSTLDQMNADFGAQLFVPITLASDDPTDVVVVDIGMLREADGFSRVTWAPSGELFDVRVTFQNSRTLHDAHVVTHEMMHALGFGHTTTWRSAVSLYDGMKTARVTPYDVAYAEMAMHSRIARERVDTRRLIALAVSRESNRGWEDEPYTGCDLQTDDSFGTRTSVRGTLPVDLLTVVAECDPIR
ncbi:MAG TPA: hypothetical protein VM099_02180 [Gemmatimonadaceae bacterium]|nr:hypothetical protein [Gemmatimonadaceae bacterium]